MWIAIVLQAVLFGFIHGTPVQIGYALLRKTAQKPQRVVHCVERGVRGDRGQDAPRAIANIAEKQAHEKRVADLHRRSVDESKEPLCAGQSGACPGGIGMLGFHIFPLLVRS